MEREEVSSPTVSTESTMLTSVIEAKEHWDVATCDIPNAFIQTKLDNTDKDGNRTVMKIRGILVDILCELDPTYKQYVVTEGGQKVLYVHVVKATVRPRDPSSRTHGLLRFLSVSFLTTSLPVGRQLSMMRGWPQSHYLHSHLVRSDFQQIRLRSTAAMGSGWSHGSTIWTL
jgi:hypothetical protein